MLRPTFSLCHTTIRPHAWRPCYDEWIAKALNPDDVEYCLVTDRRWGFTDYWTRTVGYPWLDERPGLNHLGHNDGGRGCSVDGWNLAAADSHGKVLILVSDDMGCPQYWDRSLRSLGAEGGEAADFVIQVKNGTPHDHRDPPLMALQIFSRKRYERLGYALYPGYESMACDDDFGEHARLDGVVKDGTALVFPHRHAAFTGCEFDSAYAHQNRPEAYRAGEAVLAARRACGFSA